MGLSRWEGLNNWGHTEDTPSMITPPNETDSVKNAIPSKLTKGACPPQWVDIHYSFMDGSDYTFQDGSDYDFN